MSGAPSRRGDAGLEHALGGVHDPRVDVADLGEREEVGGVRRCRGTGTTWIRRVLGVAELVRRGLVDGHGHGTRGGVGRLPGVDLLGLESPALVRHGGDANGRNPTQQVAFRGGPGGRLSGWLRRARSPRRDARLRRIRVTLGFVRWWTDSLKRLHRSPSAPSDRHVAGNRAPGQRPTPMTQPPP